jgi:hypothetical protein
MKPGCRTYFCHQDGLPISAALLMSAALAFTSTRPVLPKVNGSCATIPLALAASRPGSAPSPGVCAKITISRQPRDLADASRDPPRWPLAHDMPWCEFFWLSYRLVPPPDAVQAHMPSDARPKFKPEAAGAQVSESDAVFSRSCSLLTTSTSTRGVVMSSFSSALGPGTSPNASTPSRMCSVPT